jgi:hypothetical protein
MLKFIQYAKLSKFMDRDLIKSLRYSHLAIKGLRVQTAILFIFTFGFTIAFAQVEEDTSRITRFSKYQNILRTYRANIRQMEQYGINPFQPDYSSPGGGDLFNLTMKLKNQIKVESRKLGLKQSLDHGLYMAKVYYNNSNTLTRSKYTLDVSVDDNRVIAVKFDDGGSVHAGINSSGYTYSGGHLDLDHDINGEITRATTTVKIRTRSANLEYIVIIE